MIINYVKSVLFQRPNVLKEANWEMQFQYGPDYERRRTDLYNSGLLEETRHYFGSGAEQHQDLVNGTTRDLFYIPGPDGVAAIIKVENGDEQVYFPYADHLGSITALTDNNGNVVCRQAFDPWGRRRNPINLVTDDNALPAAYSWLHGFTGHEHLSQFKLINMNARLYDPLLGRMLSPDNYVTDASNPMTYNLYSYANNNPISYVDPDGNFIVEAIVIGAVLGGFSGWQIGSAKGATGWDMAGYVAGGAAVGAASGYLGATVAASGIPFANTAGIAAASFTNSLGTSLFTGDGQFNLSVSFGAASYNFSKGEFGYLGDEDNSTLENIGYGLGALANIPDIIAFNNGANVNLVTEKKDVISHSALVNEGAGINVSVGPRGGGYFNKSQSLAGKFKNLFSKVDGILWENHATDGHGWATPINNLNKSILSRISDNIYGGNNIMGGPLKYSGLFNSCASYVSRSLWAVGVPNIGIHPYLLHASILARQAGIYASPYLINYIKK